MGGGAGGGEEEEGGKKKEELGNHQESVSCLLMGRFSISIIVTLIVYALLSVTVLGLGDGTGSGSESGSGSQAYWLPPAFGGSSGAPASNPMTNPGAPILSPTFAGYNPGNMMQSNVAHVAAPQGVLMASVSGNAMAGYHPPSYAPPGVPPTPSAPYTSQYSVQPGAFYNFLEFNAQQQAAFQYQAWLGHLQRQVSMPYFAGYSIRESAYHGHPKVDA